MVNVINPSSMSKQGFGGEGITIINNGILGLVVNYGANFGVQIGLPLSGASS